MKTSKFAFEIYWPLSETVWIGGNFSISTGNWGINFCKVHFWQHLLHNKCHKLKNGSLIQVSGGKKCFFLIKTVLFHVERKRVKTRIMLIKTVFSGDSIYVYSCIERKGWSTGGKGVLKCDYVIYGWPWTTIPARQSPASYMYQEVQ